MTRSVDFRAAAYPFTAALMAGGKSRRMGCDKKLLKFDGVPLWLRQIRLLKSLGPAEILISGSDAGPWGQCHPVVADEMAEAGPLSGIAAILRAAQFESVLVLAVDLPLMNRAFLAELLKRGSGGGIVPRLGKNWEPLAAVYPRSCAVLAREALAVGDRSMQNFCRAVIAAQLAVTMPVEARDERLFANLNTPADLAAALHENDSDQPH